MTESDRGSTQRQPIVALTTVEAGLAESMARTLVEEGLAACVNRLAVQSTYRWQGAVHSEDEVLLVIKSTSDVAAALESRVQALHSYDVAEFVVLEPTAVSDTYLSWLRDSCRSA